ncbi:hypothetical protein GCM10010234_67070 [Streptomyces hawaiiensis]
MSERHGDVGRYGDGKRYRDGAYEDMPSDAVAVSEVDGAASCHALSTFARRDLAASLRASTSTVPDSAPRNVHAPVGPCVRRSVDDGVQPSVVAAAPQNRHARFRELRLPTWRYPMKKNWFVLGLGALLAFVGVGWTLQGLDVMKGSAMSGVTLWAVVGPVVAIVGLVVLGVGFARLRRVSR